VRPRFLSPISNNDRLLYLANLHREINTLLKDVRFEVAFVCSTPHFPWDALLSNVLLARGSRVFSLKPTLVDGRVTLHEHVRTFAEMVLIKRGQLEDSTPDSVTTRERHALLDNGLPLRTLHARSMVEDGSGMGIGEIIGLLGHWLGSLRTLSRRRNAGGGPILDTNYFGFFARFEYSRHLLGRRLQVFRLRRVVKRVETSEIPRDFCLFLLHFQPERSTDPEGGLSRFQVSAVSSARELLDASGFEDVVVVVKEHPRQMVRRDRDVRRIHARSVKFYEALAEINGVVLAEASLDTAELISSAHLVISPNGSGVWEGVKSGVPGFTFATTWHSNSGVTPTFEFLVENKERLVSLLKLSPEEVRNAGQSFLDLERCTFAGFLDARHVSVDDLVPALRATVKLLCDVVEVVAMVRSETGRVR